MTNLRQSSLRSWEARSEKIAAHHHQRLAIVYVRQSTMQQVLEHQESTRRQYGLVTRAQELGWAVERILVIDEDLGRSGATAEGRVGFQRLVSEVSLDHVGLVLGLEMSRLARSSQDWHQLVELCALFGTLIADLDGVYDPSQYNDRLLLGLKGTMSEAELHILKQRMQQGRLHKARRGELAKPVPLGYLRQPEGSVVLDPDEHVQQFVHVVFQKFTELGTLNAVLQYLVKHHLQVGIRQQTRSGRGLLEWRRPTRMTLQNLLKNPIYAGAYAYGRRQSDPRRQRRGQPSTGRVVRQPEEWYVLLHDRYPAYISWDQYEQNLARLQANRARADTPGAIRRGPALLSGVLICGKCGHRLHVQYGGRADGYSYACTRLVSDYAGPRCQHVAGKALDALVTRWACSAVAPAALELSLTAANNVEQERADQLHLWQQRLERATYEVERAARQYRLVEPENRLVARTLERDWEAALLAQHQLTEDYERFLHQQPQALTAAEQAAIRRLAEDIPALWSAPTTTMADRKAILRQLLDRVTVDAIGTTEQVRVALVWVGGHETSDTLIRPVARLEQLSYYPQLCERVRELVALGLTAPAIAARLNAEGFRPPKRREQFGPQGVLALLQRLDLRPQQSRPRQLPPLAADEWSLTALAHALTMPRVTLFNWIARGWVCARRHEQAPHHWVLWADAPELTRLRALQQLPAGAHHRRLWTETDAATLATTTIPTAAPAAPAE